MTKGRVSSIRPPPQTRGREKFDLLHFLLSDLSMVPVTVKSHQFSLFYIETLWDPPGCEDHVVPTEECRTPLRTSCRNSL